MDIFALLVVGGLVVLVAALLGLGLYHPRRAMEITDKDRHKRWVTQADIEEKDIPQMVEGQNVYRRARGEEELTEAEFRGRAAEDQRRRIAAGKRVRRSRKG